MATIYYDRDADLSLIQAKRVAVIGYGSQGHAQALNLRDSGVAVQVGLRADSRGRGKAESQGLTVATVPEAAAWADVIVMLAPDTAQPQIYADHIAPNLDRNKTLMFSHGFNIRFGTIQPPPDVAVSMVAPSKISSFLPLNSPTRAKMAAPANRLRATAPLTPSHTFLNCPRLPVLAR